LVYQYWVHPDHPDWVHLPEGVKREADAMRALWNQLVDAFAARQKRYQEILSQSQTHPPPPAAPQQLRSLLRQLQQSFLAEIRRITANCPATWADKELVLNQFLAAVSRFFKKQNGPPKHRAEFLAEVHFQHRFTGGGLPVERIFHQSQRVHLEPVSAEAFNPSLSQRQRKRLARTCGSFRAGDTLLSFVTILHRPLPIGAYLKTAALIGKQTARRGYHQHEAGGHVIPARWTWFLHLTLEVPPPTTTLRTEKGRTAALELSPRLWHDEHLCLGTLTDAAGREEALLLPEKILRCWRHKRNLQSQADQLLADTRRLLQHLQHSAELSPVVSSSFAHVGAMQSPGLWRLLQLLEETGATGERIEILRHWADGSTKMLREARGLERRYLGYRNWFYHNLALQLCQRYQRLAITTAELSESEFSTRGEKRQLQDVAAYHHLTSPSRFLLFLQHAARKTGTEIVRVKRQA
jgi:hypothetical protein